MKNSVSKFLLIVTLVILALSAAPAGLSLIIDPSGDGIGLPLSTLELSPFRNFLIPGLFLFSVFGLLPFFLIYGLIKPRQPSLFRLINPHKKEHWALVFTFYLGLVLILWISIQLMMGVTHDALHFTYTIIGILVVILANLPTTRKCYKLP
ncbi:MAG: hypothetical protein KJO90_02755 [Eudoraea sp.]|nr:hypothetical protein [Eudoraea sp.]